MVYLLIALVLTASVAAYLLYLLMGMRKMYLHGVPYYWLGFPAGTETKVTSRYFDSAGNARIRTFTVAVGEGGRAVIPQFKGLYKTSPNYNRTELGE